MAENLGFLSLKIYAVDVHQLVEPCHVNMSADCLQTDVAAPWHAALCAHVSALRVAVAQLASASPWITAFAAHPI
jgi:hypothetical protein